MLFISRHTSDIFIKYLCHIYKMNEIYSRVTELASRVLLYTVELKPRRMAKYAPKVSDA